MHRRSLRLESKSQNAFIQTSTSSQRTTGRTGVANRAGRFAGPLICPSYKHRVVGVSPNVADTELIHEAYSSPNRTSSALTCEVDLKSLAIHPHAGHPFQTVRGQLPGTRLVVIPAVLRDSRARSSKWLSRATSAFCGSYTIVCRYRQRHTRRKLDRNGEICSLILIRVIVEHDETLEKTEKFF